MKGYPKISNLIRLSTILIITLCGFAFVLVQNTYGSPGSLKNDTSFSYEVTSRPVDIWSDGTRLSGDLWYPKDMKVGDRLPAVILCHGWGGLRSDLNAYYAPLFAKAGYVVLTFDYRGWGDSDSRLVFKGKMPKPGPDGKITVEAQAIRELVDPFDQTEDIVNTINFITGEPIVDFQRIGLWGTSYGGGHIVYVAAHDDRVKCIVSQVGSMDSRGMSLFKGGIENVRIEASMRARGEIDPVPQGVDQVPGLRGTPFIDRMVNYAPVNFARQLKIPVLIIEAEKEELMNIKEHGQLVYNLIKDKSIAKYELLPGITHFEVYTIGRMKAIKLAIDWFDRHLKK